MSRSGREEMLEAQATRLRETVRQLRIALVTVKPSVPATVLPVLEKALREYTE